MRSSAETLRGRGVAAGLVGASFVYGAVGWKDAGAQDLAEHRLPAAGANTSFEGEPEAALSEALKRAKGALLPAIAAKVFNDFPFDPTPEDFANWGITETTSRAFVEVIKIEERHAFYQPKIQAALSDKAQIFAAAEDLLRRLSEPSEHWGPAARALRRADAAIALRASVTLLKLEHHMTEEEIYRSFRSSASVLKRLLEAADGPRRTLPARFLDPILPNYSAFDPLVGKMLPQLIARSAPDAAFVLWVLAGRHFAEVHRANFPLLPLSMEAGIEHAAISLVPEQPHRRIELGRTVDRIKRLHRRAASAGVVVELPGHWDWHSADNALAKLHAELFKSAFENGNQQAAWLQVTYSAFFTHAKAIPRGPGRSWMRWKKKLQAFSAPPAR